jgi:hypothetical protein
MLSERKLVKLFHHSTWIVPCETLKAVFTVDNISRFVSDQTVWIIDSYDSGYIFGSAYVTLDGNPTSKFKIVGSISSLGDVLFSFISGNITTGIGKFLKIDGKWQFVMQTNSLDDLMNNVIGISHWSYMIKVDPCDCRYQHLPGVGISVPDFIALFD